MEKRCGGGSKSWVARDGVMWRGGVVWRRVHMATLSMWCGTMGRRGTGPFSWREARRCRGLFENTYGSTEYICTYTSTMSGQHERF